MKTHFAPLLAGLLALIASPGYSAAPEEPFRYSVLFDLKARTATPVVGYRLTTLPGFLGTRLEPEVWSVAGVDLPASRAVAGVAAVLPWRAARNLVVYMGAAARVAESRPVGLGWVAGLRLTFGGGR